MNHLIEKAKNIRCLICDIDGVLTSGHLYYDAQGERIKSFHVHDGVGLKLCLLAGIEIAIITTGKTPIIAERMKDLGIKHVYSGYFNKLLAYETLQSTLKLLPEQVAMIGDDLPDLNLMQAVGFSIAPANAVSEVKHRAHWVTHASGGQGAVREVCDLILSAQHLKEIALQKLEALPTRKEYNG